MNKIKYEKLETLRNNYMKDNEVNSVQEVSMYESSDFSSVLLLALSGDSDINKELLEEVSLCDLYKEESKDLDLVEFPMYDEKLILMRNNNELPLGLNVKQLNVLDLGFYSWIEYGIYNKEENKLDVTYYDAESLKGVNKLFDLPYFKRQFNILEGYLKDKGLIDDFKITTTNTDVIEGFNKWFIGETTKYDNLIDCVNDLELKIK